MALGSARSKTPKKKHTKGGTVSNNKHRFQSFNQRIANLDIDPVRKRRNRELNDESSEDITSFFLGSLGRWRDLNLSDNFRQFSEKVQPWCQSLPQIIHHDKIIFDLLVHYINKQDQLCLEPLLDLLSQFAHDLGSKFEVYFFEAVRSVASLVASCKEVDVIDWSFTCLTWLFKYLSRLLTPNLAPLYRIMAPLLGKEPQKPYTTRFTAEAMSFLVRKAASTYGRDPQPLRTVMGAILGDLATDGAPALDGQKQEQHKRSSEHHKMRLEQYKSGIMTLLINAMLGVGRKLHSHGLSTYRCLFETVKEGFEEASIDGLKAVRDVFYGTTIAAIHRTDSEGLKPILSFVLAKIQQVGSQSSEVTIDMLSYLLFLFSAVRKGTRVIDWQDVSSAGLALLRYQPVIDSASMPEIYKAIGVIMQSAPMSVVLYNFRPVMDIIDDDSNTGFFLDFCDYFNGLGRERFEHLLAPHLSRFITKNWNLNTSKLLVKIPNLIGDAFEKKPICPKHWQQHILEMFRTLPETEEQLVERFHYLESIPYLTVPKSFSKSLVDLLVTHVNNSLHKEPSTSVQYFLFGPVLRSIVAQSSPLEYRVEAWWPILCKVSTSYARLPLFLESILAITHNPRDHASTEYAATLVDALLNNLHTASPVLRKLSLEILERLESQNDGSSSDVMQLLLAMENTPRTHASARSLSMQARRLASTYHVAAANPIIKRAIPHFCFGMLTYRLAQARDDAIVALKGICDNSEGASIVSRLTFSWLQSDQPRSRQPDNDEPENPDLGKAVNSDCQCSNVANIDALSSTLLLDRKQLAKRLNAAYGFAMRLESADVDNAPSLALSVLVGNPRLAENHSDRIVPLFLSWAAIEHSPAADSSTSPEISACSEPVWLLHNWSQNDRKAFLDLFTHFKTPQALYEADKVFEALKGLLCNGDTDIQRSALKAIFTWKISELSSYQARLLNMLDDSHIREEIATLLNPEKTEVCVQEEHRPVLMPILLRLLYGRMIAQSGSSSIKGDQTTRRKVILRAVALFDESYVAEFLSLALGNLEKGTLVSKDDSEEAQLSQRMTVARRHLGTLNAKKTMLESLGSKLEPHASRLYEALFYCLRQALSSLNTYETPHVTGKKSIRLFSLCEAIRRTSLQCLNLMARDFSPEAFRPYAATFYSEILSPRLENLAVETSQSVSNFLHLLSTWAASPSGLSFLIDYDERAILAVSVCLTLEYCKDEVKLFVMEHILLQMLTTMKETVSTRYHRQSLRGFDDVKDRILHTSSKHLLQTLTLLLKKTLNKSILQCGISLVNMLALMTDEVLQAPPIVEVAISLLGQPAFKVSPKSKGELLRILARFLPSAKPSFTKEYSVKVFNILSSMFAYFKDRENRLTLILAFRAFAEDDIELVEVTGLCQSLNAYSVRKVDEPDFDERLKAFNMINEGLWIELSAKQWQPLIENMLFYLKDEEESSIRSNAAFALRRFVEALTSKGTSAAPEMHDLLQLIFLPNIRKGAAESSELVRSEYLGIMAHLVRHNPQYYAVTDLQPLLGGNDEESSFFTNVLHIQRHRRLAALRRLSSHANTTCFQSSNVAHFLIPLLEHFIFNKGDGEAAYNLSAEAATTIGTLALSLEWPQYRAIFRRYCTFLDRETDHLKSAIRLLGRLTDTLGKTAAALASISSGQDIVDSGQSREHVAFYGASVLAKTLPKDSKFANEVRTSLLPMLKHYVHDKDETTVSLRVPVAISAVKLLKLLPDVELQQLLPPVLTDICNVLRSRAQESRDLARQTLAKISAVIGPGYFNFLLKELRTALARGYQLHVLSFTVHALLVEASSQYQSGDLDHCLPQIVAIVIEDVLGKTGQEKDAEEYTSKMKEVKSSKSFDTMELVAKMATVTKLVHLVEPLQSLLEEKHDLRTLRKIDELLRRIGAGVVRNGTIADQRFLVFCYEIIRQASGSGPASDSEHGRRSERKGQCIPANTDKQGNISPYRKKLVRFAFDLLRSVLVKHDALQTPANLHGFIPILGDAIVQPDEEIQLSAIRLLTAIIKVPLRSIDEDAGVYVAESVKIIRNTASTHIEISQAAYKLVAVILRDRQPVAVREGDLAYLLKRLVPDLDQPDKQGGAFNFLKAVMNRKVVITEVYEVLDIVAMIMVTNHTKSARDIARGAYVQFIMDYPQTEDRFQKQVGFLIRNLKYKHVEGRQSVMEALHLLFIKPGEEFAQKTMGQAFVPLVMILTNDESSQCRKMAGALLRVSLERANEQLNHSLVKLLRSWLDRRDDLLLQRAAFQTYGFLLDVRPFMVEREVAFLLPKLIVALEGGLKEPSNADWERMYYMLQDVSKLWACIRKCLFYPHVWIKLSASKLMSAFYADIARSNASEQAQTLPLKGSGGLWLKKEEIYEVTRASLRFIKAGDNGEEAANQHVRNLVFLGKIMMQTSLTWPSPKVDMKEAPEEDAGPASDSDRDAQESEHRPALGYLISQTARILRRPLVSTKAQSLIPLKSSLRLLAVMTNAIDSSMLQLHISCILVPLNNLTDANIAAPFSTDADFTEGYSQLVANARDLMSKIQEKVGTTAYLKALHGVREMAKGRREERQTKRAIERVTDPERAGRQKFKKSEKKREKRKERHSDHRAMRRGW